tara:strand:- start:835 stop:2577 length:1743 start_codon:yes stop_codon:yes gene_type:complete
MSKINQDDIDRIRDLADIVDVVSQFVDLKNRGNNFFGLCPFHNEKTPSFSVAPAKQIFHCFGCGKGGNVFSFIMDYQKISFPESIKILADKYNVSLEIDKKNIVPEIYSSIYNLHEIAENLYKGNLFSNKGALALGHLKDRGLSIETIKKFNIGYAFNEWDQLVKTCKGKGFTKQSIEKSGLFINSDKGIFDRFRSRIMFPIYHLSGKTIGFGARIFEIEDPAKYLNSPETLVYKKSDVLYGLKDSRNEILKEGYAILVEGYMDFLQLYQAEIYPVVAVSGTAFTERHALAVKRITKKVILLYDGDAAGGNAVIQAGWVMLKLGIEPCVVRPPKDKDPDDWVRESGANSVKESIKKAMDFSDFHIKYFEAKKLTGSKRQDYLFKISKEINEIKDGIVKNDLIRVFSQNLMVDELDFLKLMEKTRSKKNSKIEDYKPINKLNFDTKIDKAQIELLKVLCNNQNKTKDYIKEKISLKHFSTPLFKTVARYLLDDELDFPSVIEKFEGEERDSITKILFMETLDIPSEEIVSDCLKILISAPIKEKINSIRVSIREKESNGDYPIAEISEIEKYRKQLNDLKI